MLHGDSADPACAAQDEPVQIREAVFILEHLIDDVFGYTLESGESLQYERGCRKVNTEPKSGKSLVTALNNAVHNTMVACYDPDWYEIKEV